MKKTEAESKHIKGESLKTSKQSGSDREMLKARARWLSANNPITKSIDKSIIKNGLK